MRLIAFILMFVTLQSYAQPNISIVKAQALEMGRAMSKGDSKTFSKYIPADLLQNPEDAKFILKMIDSGFTMFKTFGGEIKKIQFGHPSEIVSDGKKWQTAMVQSTTIVSPFADAEVQSVLLAQSIDEGKHWTFVDMSLNKINHLKSRMPKPLPKLVLPKALPPKITMKEVHQ